jgi:hypothetical protein
VNAKAGFGAYADTTLQRRSSRTTLDIPRTKRNIEGEEGVVLRSKLDGGGWT